MLPDTAEPLVLADGTRIDPTTGSAVRMALPGLIEVPRHSDAQKIVTQTRRKLSDLPAPPRTMNAISAILLYTTIGLSDIEIAIATTLTEQQVANIKMSDAYAQAQELLVRSMVDNDAEDVRTMFAMNARHAARRVIDTMNDKDADITVALRAADSILDRAGHRPVDVVEHRHRMDGALLIEVVSKKVEDDGTPTVPLSE